MSRGGLIYTNTLLSTTIVRDVMTAIGDHSGCGGIFKWGTQNEFYIFFSDTNTVANTLQKWPTPATPDADADDTIPGLTVRATTPKTRNLRRQQSDSSEGKYFHTLVSILGTF